MADSIPNISVKQGDTLWGLAQKHKELGKTQTERLELLKTTFGKDPKKLQPGDKLDVQTTLGAQAARKNQQKPLAFKPEEAKGPKTPLNQDIDLAIASDGVSRLEEQVNKTVAETDKALANPANKKAEELLTPPKAGIESTSGTIAGKNGAETHAKLIAALGPKGTNPITQDIQISPQFSPQEMRNFAQADMNYVDSKNAGQKAGVVEPKELEALGLPAAAVPTYMNNIDGVVSGKADGVIDLNEKTALTAFADAMDGTKDGKYSAQNNDAMNYLLATDQPSAEGQPSTARSQLLDVVNQYKQYEPTLFQ